MEELLQELGFVSIDEKKHSYIEKYSGYFSLSILDAYSLDSGFYRFKREGYKKIIFRDTYFGEEITIFEYKVDTDNKELIHRLNKILSVAYREALSKILYVNITSLPKRGFIDVYNEELNEYKKRGYNFINSYPLLTFRSEQFEVYRIEIDECRRVNRPYKDDYFYYECEKNIVLNYRKLPIENDEYIKSLFSSNLFDSYSQCQYQGSDTWSNKKAIYSIELTEEFRRKFNIDEWLRRYGVEKYNI